MTKKTYGQIVTETVQTQTLDDDIKEYRRLMDHDLVKVLEKTGQDASKNELYLNKDFYLVTLFKNELIAHNMPRRIVFARRSCPTPHYKQGVWKYHHNSGALEFLWAIPSPGLCEYIYKRRGSYTTPDEQFTEACVVMFTTGKLDEFVAKENGYKKDMLIRIHKEIVA